MNILKSKKGIAIENTILFMMIIFSLCFLIASLTLMGHYQGKIEKVALENKIELDQIGEDFLAGRLDPATDNNGKYYWSFGTNEDNSNPACTVTAGENGPVVLYVEYEEAENGTRTPTAWRYSEQDH